jgi:hypothetical protein
MSALGRVRDSDETRRPVVLGVADKERTDRQTGNQGLQPKPVIERQRAFTASTDLSAPILGAHFR